MNKNVQIRTDVLGFREGEMQIRNVLIVLRDNGLRSTHIDVFWKRHLGKWQRISAAIHDRFVVQVQEWLDTGMVGKDLEGFGLEQG
jgi:hypothetical protein